MRSSRVRAVLGLAALVVSSAAAARAQGPYPPPPGRYYHGGGGGSDRFGEFRLWIGGFRPDAHDQYWNDNFRDFNANRSDYQDLIGGGDFIYHFDRYNAVMFSASFYSTANNIAYRNFLDQDNRRIRHDNSLDIASGSVAYVLFPAGTHTPVIPYLGAGVGVYGWRLREVGDFVDFANNNAIFSARFVDNGAAFAYFFVAGLEVPVTRHVAFLVDGRYTKSHENLRGDFAGFGRLDLSGGQIVGGIAWHL
jgi:opacity protein-like surface antigen